MRKVAKVVAIVAGLALAALIGVIVWISSRAEGGLIDASLIPFVIAALVALVTLIIALIMMAVLPIGE